MNKFIKKSFPFTKNAGFTLIELLVVVLIIGILSSVALPQYQLAVAKSRYVQVMMLADSYRKAEEVFFLANGSYTFYFDDLDVGLPAGWKVERDGKEIRSADEKTLCTLQDGSGNGNLLTVYCRRSKLIYYVTVNGTRLCGVLDEDPVGIRLCKSLGGVPHATNSIYYQLP